MVKSSKQPGRRSRAARRATSPSLNTDKSLKNVKPPPEGIDHRPAILALHHGAGVTKRTKKSRHVSTRKRRRQERGVARAELATDKLELKVAKSIGKGKSIKGRKATWDELNSVLSSVANVRRGPLERKQEKDSEQVELQSMPVEAEMPSQSPTEQKDVVSELQKVGDISLTGEDDAKEEEEEEEEEIL